MNMTYHSYLKIKELLNLQELQSPGEHDEMLFIIIHQSYELWFKEMLHELDFIASKLEEGDLTRAGHNMKRVLTILKVVVHQVDILETMSPLEFLSFRNYLQSASGFQSYQWRELEFLLGQKAEVHLQRFESEPDIWEKLNQRYHAPSIWLRFLKYLHTKGYEFPLHDFENPITQPTKSTEVIQNLIKEIYRSDSAIAEFCERLVDLDEGIQEWRYRHVKMVERTIGNKQGTGGSAGVEYLKSSLFKPLFPDLWEVRSNL